MSPASEASAASEDRLLREHLAALLAGKQAHVDFNTAVSELSLELQGEKPQGASHTPWEILEHLRIAQWDIIEFSRNPSHVSPNFPAGYWPEAATPPESGSWEKSVGLFQADLEAFRVFIKDPSTDLYSPLPHGDGQTVLREVLVLADHNAYHLGEMIVVRRLLGAWS